jgi:hypothetical protein
MDGGMVNIRDEGWKEMKVGTVFDIELRLERDPQTHDLVERPHGVHMAYAAVLGSVDEFAPALWRLAWQHGIPTAADSSVTADGAEWIWNLVADYFKKKNSRMMTFEELANASTGAERIGVLKGDVDLLGNFFRSMDSPSKLATASRFMDYFFKVYLNQLIDGKFGYIAGKVPSLREWPEKPDITVVYAGGDDFFIVGAWDQVFELAFRVREAFRTYTGDGLNLIYGADRLYLHVPTKVRQFTISMRGWGAETPRVNVFDPAGKQVATGQTTTTNANAAAST